MSHTSSHVERGAGVSERRSYPRQLVQSLAYVELGYSNGGVALNVSEGGMAVQAIMSLYDDELPRLRVQLSHFKEAIEARAHIVWASDQRKLVGIEFIDLPEETRKLLREWVSLENQGFSTEASPPIEKSAQTIVAQSATKPENPRPTRVAEETTRAWANHHFLTPRPDVPIASLPVATAAVATAAPGSGETRNAVASREVDFGKSRKWQWLFGLAVIVALFSAGFFELRGKRTATSSETKREALTDSRLGLKLDWTGTDWRLSWNPDAPALLKATKGQLFVTDGALEKTVDLDASDLHSGTIIYSPLTNDVVWKLQLTDATDSGEPISESVRTVSGLPSVLAGPLRSEASTAATSGRVISTPAETYIIKSGREINGTLRPDSREKTKPSDKTSRMLAPSVAEGFSGIL